MNDNDRELLFTILRQQSKYYRHLHDDITRILVTLQDIENRLRTVEPRIRGQEHRLTELENAGNGSS